MARFFRAEGAQRETKTPRAKLAMAAGLLLLVSLLSAGALARSGQLGGSASNGPAIKEFPLVAQETAAHLHPRLNQKAWTYNGTMPAPEIRVKEGDHVRVTLTNELPTATTIHFHGVDLPNNMDGPAGLSQAPVEPGESFVYDFIATPGGTRWYHTHTDVSSQILLGLYGAFIVEPKHAEKVDRDYTYILTEWDAELTPDVALGNEPRGKRDQTLRGGEYGTDYFLMNGKMNDAIPPIVVTEGDKVRIRLINAGNVPHPFHIHGHSFKIVATDGNPVPADAQLTKDTVLVAPGERYDIEFVANNPGVWMVHCHIENHADNGMMTLLEYEGSVPPGPLGQYWTDDGKTVPMHSPDMGDMSMSMDHGATTNDPDATPQPGVEPAATSSAGEPNAPLATSAAGAPDAPASTAESGESEPTMSPSDPQDVTVTDEGTTVILSDNRFAPKEITVKAGTPLTFINEGANWHSVAGANGLINVDQLASGASYTVVIDEPGTYNLICKHHLRQGMTAKLIVTE
jgi:FtsP/CotA-like multicopper oxidase with cupredoxin domain